MNRPPVDTGPDGEPLDERLAVLLAHTRARMAAEAETARGAPQIRDRNEEEDESMPGCPHCRDLDHTSAPFCRCPCHNKDIT